MLQKTRRHNVVKILNFIIQYLTNRWRLAHNCMPTNDQLRLHGCIVVSVYLLCLSCFVSTYHMFFDHPFAKSTWFWLQTKFRINLDFRTPIVPLLCCSQSPIESIIFAGMLHTMHTI